MIIGSIQEHPFKIRILLLMVRLGTALINLISVGILLNLVRFYTMNMLWRLSRPLSVLWVRLILCGGLMPLLWLFLLLSPFLMSSGQAFGVLKSPKEIKYFISRLCHDALPLKRNLFTRRLCRTHVFPMCGVDEETSEHAFLLLCGLV